MTNRKLTKVEKKMLLSLPISAMHRSMIESKLDEFVVEEMNDGGMGSLYFLSTNKKHHRHLRATISEVQTKDADEVAVSISLSSDNFGNIYELDIWKVDFSPLKDLNKCIENLPEEFLTDEWWKKRGL